MADGQAASWVSPLPETASGAANNAVVLAAMMLRDFFSPPSPALLQGRLGDALRLYKSPAIARYALGKGADANLHGDAFVELARAGDGALMDALLEGGLDVSLHAEGMPTVASRALYAAARAGQAGTVALLLEKIAFTAEDFDGVEGAEPAIQSVIHAAQRRMAFAGGPHGGLAQVRGASASFNTSAEKRAENPAPKPRARPFSLAVKNPA